MNNNFIQTLCSTDESVLIEAWNDIRWNDENTYYLWPMNQLENECDMDIEEIRSELIDPENFSEKDEYYYHLPDGSIRSTSQGWKLVIRWISKNCELHDISEDEWLEMTEAGRE